MTVRKVFDETDVVYEVAKLESESVLRGGSGKAKIERW